MFNRSGSFVYAIAFALIGVAIVGEQKLGAFIVFAIAAAFAVDGLKKMRGTDTKPGDQEPDRG